MAAGLGFKTFTTGEVLTAADTNGYLMQGVLVFASAAARDAAITSPQEGQYCYLKDTNSTQYYDGATWVSGVEGDISGVTAGIGISGGGTSGTVTVTNSMATAIDAKGDLVVGTGADTFSKLTAGANETRIVADSAEATGLKYVADTTNYAIAAKGNLLAGTAADTLTALTVGADYTFLQALASAGTTGLQYAGTWTAYTPTVTATTGSFTTTSASGRYLRIGQACIVAATVTITTVGTGTGVKFSLPFTSANAGQIYIGSVRESAVTGLSGVVIVDANSTTGLFGKYDNSAYQGNGYVFRSTTVFEVA